MGQIIYFSTSTGDIPHILSSINKTAKKNPSIKIIVIENKNNFNYLKSLNLIRVNIQFLDFKEEKLKNFPKQLEKLLTLFTIAKKINALATLLIKKKTQAVYFYNLETTPLNYLIYKISTEIHCHYIDAHRFDRVKITYWEILKTGKWKTLCEFFLYQNIFNKIFILSNHSENPTISIDLSQTNVFIVKSNKQNFKLKSQWLWKISNKTNKPFALYLFDWMYGIQEEEQVKIHFNICLEIQNAGFHVLIKPHPMVNLPNKFDAWTVIPKHIPSEMINKKNISAIIGTGGNSFSGFNELPLFSVLNLFPSLSKQKDFLVKRMPIYKRKFFDIYSLNDLSIHLDIIKQSKT